MKSTKWENWVNFFVGIWVFFIPWQVGSHFISEETVVIRLNFWVVGALVTCISALALYNIKIWEEWINLFAGVWLFLSPWVLGYSQENVFVWNAIIAGIVIALLSGMAIPYEKAAREQTH